MTNTDKALLKKFIAQSDGDSKIGFELFERHKILTDLYYFGSEVMGWKNAKRGRRRRLQPSLHKWYASELQKEEDMLALIARLHLKTTWVKLKIVQCILNNPMIRIAFVSETSTLVEEGLSDIKRMFAHPTVRKYFPEIVPDPRDFKQFRGWDRSNVDELTVSRSAELEALYGKPPAEPQIMAIGVGKRIQGLHFDIAFVDDIIGPSSVTTMEQMRKTEDWWAYFQSIMEIDAPIIMTGTFYHPQDIYNKIIKEKQFDRVFRRPAIEGGKVLYSNWFTKKDLDKIRKRQGEFIYNAQYMLNPLPDSEKMFRAPYPTYKALEPGRYKTYIAIDPAGTARSHSDDSGVAVGMVDERDNMYLEEVVGVKLTHDPKAQFSFADFLINLVIKYQPLRVGMEMGILEAIRFIIEAKVTAWENIHQGNTDLAVLHNIMPIPISRQKSKAQRINLSLGSFIREGRCFINERNTDLLHQMSLYSGKDSDSDDLVDASSMLFSLHDRFAQHYWVAPQFRQKGTTFFDIAEMGRPKDTWSRRFIS